jgi:hypothetical protein
MESLILFGTTLPHYVAIIPATPTPYRLTIFVSTTLSVIWHFYGQPNGALLYMNYTAAFLWAFYDIGLAIRKRRCIDEVAMANAALLFLSVHIPPGPMYFFLHSLWHIVSATKCLYFAMKFSLQISHWPARSHIASNLGLYKKL